MIRHVVSWKLTAQDAATRESDIAAITAGLTSLPSVIPEILELTVGRNVASYPDNFDIVLIADYESLEALEAYQVHPEHIRVANEIVRPRVSGRSNVDFEL